MTKTLTTTVCLVLFLLLLGGCDVGNSSNRSDVKNESNSSFNPQETTLDCNFVCVVDAETGELIQVEKTCSGTGPDLVENLEAFNESDCNSFVEIP